MVLYFCAMWTQYCTGIFRLGRINAVDEGLPVYALFCFIAPSINVNIFNEHHWYGKYNEEFIYTLGILLMVQMFSINKNINKDRIKKKREVAFMTLLPLTAGATLLGLYFTITPETAK